MKLAAIDIGTNSIHLVVVEFDGRTFHVIDREKSMVRLGLGMFGEMRLTERAFNEGVEVLGRYTKLAESRGVEEILAVATSATREADNGTEFLNAIFQTTGVMPRVISGSEEARLIFLAVKHSIDFAGERGLVIDIGGGSVEVAVGNSSEVMLAQSMRLGVQRLLHRQGGAQPLSTRELYELSGYVQGAAAEVMSAAKRYGATRFVGTSGTIRTLGEGAHLLAGGAPFRSLNAQSVKRRDLRELVKRLCEADVAKRSKMPGIGDARADTVHLGGVLLCELLEMVGAEELTLCDTSLREGVIWDYIERHGVDVVPHRVVSDPRRRSVVELMRKYDRDDPRELHIADLALSLFDQTHDIHGLGAAERELLEYASLLHGVGRHIDYEDRERHARYIIRNSSLRGFTDEEIEQLGLVALYHRGSRPKRRGGKLDGLPKREQKSVVVLSAILRLAVALDRGHSQLVRRLLVEEHKKQLRIAIDGPGDLLLELWAGRDKVEPLAKALGRSILLERAALGPSTALTRGDSVVPEVAPSIEEGAAASLGGRAVVHRA
ncbi:MAG TPA: Ppx/GppA phosphatase family protein [Polyangiaceae bacterium]|nr:Ppx/GppA phosphatase family protein [Polyangiaceae bacterium]